MTAIPGSSFSQGEGAVPSARLSEIRRKVEANDSESEDSVGEVVEDPPGRRSGVRTLKGAARFRQKVTATDKSSSCPSIPAAA